MCLFQGILSFAGAVFDELIRLKIDVQDALISVGKGLGDVGIHHPGAAGLLVGLLCHGVLMLDAHHVGDILTHAQDAQPSVGIHVLLLCSLELALVSLGIQDILEEDVRLVHGHRHPVILDKVQRRLGIEDLPVGKTHHLVRSLLVGVVGKRLVAGKVNSRLCILCERHAGHVVQKGCNRILELRDLPGGLCFLLGLRQTLAQFLGIPVVVQHHGYHYHEQTQREDGIQGVGAADIACLFLQEGNSLLPDSRIRIIRGMALMVFEYVVDRPVRRILGGSGNPHHGCEDDQDQKDYPDNDPLPVFADIVLADKRAEIDQSEY